MSSLHPAAAGLDLVAEIALQSAALADAAEDNLGASVQHCPGWTVAELVFHLIEVQWFWAAIVDQRLSAPPQVGRPDRPANAALTDGLRAETRHLVEVLRRADPADGCWTWTPIQQNVAFVLRHQAQEAAVHRWDAEHAAGRDVRLGVPVAVDSIEEFLTFSVASPADPPPEPRPALEGAFVLQATDTDAAWTVSDADIRGTTRFERGALPRCPVVAGTASELLLWCYRRVGLPEAPPAAELIERFRALSFTD